MVRIWVGLIMLLGVAIQVDTDSPGEITKPDNWDNLMTLHPITQKKTLCADELPIFMNNSWNHPHYHPLKSDRFSGIRINKHCHHCHCPPNQLSASDQKGQVVVLGGIAKVDPSEPRRHRTAFTQHRRSKHPEIVGFHMVLPQFDYWFAKLDY